MAYFLKDWFGETVYYVICYKHISITYLPTSKQYLVSNLNKKWVPKNECHFIKLQITSSIFLLCYYSPKVANFCFVHVWAPGWIFIPSNLASKDFLKQHDFYNREKEKNAWLFFFVNILYFLFIKFPCTCFCWRN